MSTDVADRIREEIRARGPIGFARYMELALYGEGGYYARPPVGVGGDFVTSPHVHPVFATLLARAIRELHQAVGGPTPLRLTEAGAGDGTLARALLAELEDIPVVFTAVDVSPGARELLATVPGIASVGARPDAPFDVLVANELLDNLPFRVLRDGREVGVGLDAHGDLEEVLLDRGGAPDDGTDGIVPEGALAFVDLLARMLGADRGAALLIDYGTEGAAGTPHGYAEHRVVGHLLAAPGRTDITAGVDFALLRAHARARGLTTFPTVTQRAALTALGYEAWSRERLEGQQAHLAAGEGQEAVRTWSDRSRASLLVDPGALGRFRWMVLASPGVVAPPWLTAASAERQG